VFLLRGKLLVPGYEPATEALSLYRIKDVTQVGLCGITTIVIVEEGAEEGRCVRDTLANQEWVLRDMKRPTKT
jgi:hypothetical protein